MTVPVAGETLATITSYPELVEAFRTVKARLGLSNEFVDEKCQFSGGFTDKLLGPTQNKKISAFTFSMFCQLFAVKFHMEIDLDAVRKMEAVWERREERNVRDVETRVSKKLIERAKPHVLKQRSKEMNAARQSKLPRELRSKIARKAGKKRMSKVTKAQRSAMNRKGWVTRRAAKLSASPKRAATDEQSTPA